MTLPGPHVYIAGRQAPAYRLFGLLGLAVGVGVALLVARGTGVPMIAVPVATAAGLASAVCVIALRVAVVGCGDLFWSEHETIVLMAVVAVGARYGDPRALLDAAMPGVVLILACGRIGCQLAGCCYGRPARAGARAAVRYGDRHADAGFPRGLVGVPLVPAQVMESVWCVAVATGGVLLASSQPPPGATFVAVLGARAAGRIVIEWYRGDERLRVPGPGTGPQYWAVAGSAAMLAASAAGMLPVGAWTTSPVAALAAFVIGAVLTARAPARARSGQQPRSSRRADAFAQDVTFRAKDDD